MLRQMNEENASFTEFQLFWVFFFFFFTLEIK